MKSNPEDYPVTTHLEWGGLMRYLAYGPLSGALSGIAQFMVSLVIVIIHNDIDAAFRGRQGVVVTLFMLLFIGSMQGVAGGLVLRVYEGFSRRRVRPVIALPFILSMVFLVTFWAQTMDPRSEMKGVSMILAMMMAPFLFGVLAPIFTSARPLEE